MRIHKIDRWKIHVSGLAVVMLSAIPGVGQTTLPVYRVTGSGFSSAQAATLASSLRIPSGLYSTAEGVVSFIDPTNYIAVPTTPITNAAALSNLLAGSVNRNPAIPLQVQEIDWGTLTNLAALGSNAAVSLTTSALSAAGLTPQFGSPVASHTTMSWSYSNEFQVPVTNSQSLDTEVAYQFTDPGGYPLIGPGQLVRVAYQPGNSNCTHLYYAARQLLAGPAVTIFSASEASNRVAGFYAGLNAQIGAELVYYCPPPSFSGVSSIIPHYLCGGTAQVTNPETATASTINLLQKLIPATDDPAYVPRPILSVGVNAAGQVSASVAVTGGQTPYSYSWHGSNPALSSNFDASVTYTPLQFVAPLVLAPYRNGAGQLVVSWFDPTDNLALQSTTTLSPTAWQPDTHSITTSNGMKSIVIDTTLAGAAGGTMFFRLIYQSNPRAENVRVVVTDANGIASTVSQIVVANHQPQANVTAPPGAGVTWFLWDWGTESPWYTGDDNLGAWDTDGWRMGMKACPGAGNEKFDWNDQQATAQDYISAWFGNNGVAEIRGVDTASIVFHVGHGDPDTVVYNGSPDLTDGNKGLPHSWGDHAQGNESELSWLCFLACNLMQEKSDQQYNITAPCEKRWGPAFDGLHLMLGFTTVAQAETPMAGKFTARLLGCNGQHETLQQAWFSSAAESFSPKNRLVGLAAAMSPITTVWNGNKMVQISEINDYFWGQGPVGISIPWNKINGFVFVSQ